MKDEKWEKSAFPELIMIASDPEEVKKFVAMVKKNEVAERESYR